LPTTIAPNETETLSIIVNIDQTGISRGPQYLYLEIDSDDPDYFLNSVFAKSHLSPTILATLVGGCLVDTTTLFFGPTGDFIWVTNTGRMGSDDWTPNVYRMLGINGLLFQGTYIHGVSQRRIAFEGYFGGDGPWISWQADPNWCDNDCKPYLDTATLCFISYDGLTYTAIAGHKVCESGVDSVQDFAHSGPWNWEDHPAPFDNDSTFGLYVNGRTVGVVDQAEVNNVALEIYEFTERNGRSLPGWKFMNWVDDDLAFVTANQDTICLDRPVSAGWSGDNDGTGLAVGFVKVPFGCVDGWDGRPIKNGLSLLGTQAMYAAGAAYFDSAYIYGSLAPGAYARHGNVDPQGDQQAHFTFVERDIAPNETFSFGIAHFGFDNLAATTGVVPEIRTLARFVNKWSGFGRGDVDNDNDVDLGDVMYLVWYVSAGGPGPIPFLHLGDVNADGLVDQLDVDYLVNYYCNCGICPKGAWCF
jgi:hypothetical protein